MYEELNKISKIREIWLDVEPFDEEEGDATLMRIEYPIEMFNAINLFKRIYKNNELSERALQLTKEIIEYNSASYTVWVYRRRCLKELQINLNYELMYIKKMVSHHLKNYQVWYHYRWTVDNLNTIGEEMEYNDELLYKDEKNISAWAFRSWLMERFDVLNGQLEFANQLLTADFRNNSVWNFRHLVLLKCLERNKVVDILEEIRRIMKYILLDVSNESPFSYLKAIMDCIPSAMNEVKSISESEVHQFMSDIFEFYPTCRFAAEYLADVAIQKQNLLEAEKMYSKLIEIDPIRKQYWRWCQQMYCISSTAA